VKKDAISKTLLARLNLHLTIHIISLTSTAFPYTSPANNLNYYCTTTQWHTQEFFPGGSTNSVEDRGQKGWGYGGRSLLVRGSGGSCNLVQEISFHMVKFS